MGLSAEAAAELRERMAAALAAAASGSAAAGDDVDEQYGAEMWARCEALTAGAALFGLSFLLLQQLCLSVADCRQDHKNHKNLAALYFAWLCYKASCRNPRRSARVIICRNVLLNFYVTLHTRLRACPGACRPGGRAR